MVTRKRSNMNLIKESLLTMFLILNLIGCTYKTPLITTSKEIMPSTVISLPATITHSLIEIVISTKTVTPSPSITTTPTLVNTLEPEFVKETIQPLLGEPLNCEEPCFWGITPGKTPFDEAKNLFGQLGFIPFEGKDQYSGRDFYTITINNKVGELNSYVTLFPENNIVKNIEVTPVITQTVTGIHSNWIAYSPETLIKQFGEPSRVGIDLSYGPRFWIALIMYFENTKLIVYYDGYDLVPDHPNSPLLCPTTAPFDKVTLYMGENPPNPPLEGMPLEKATSLTIDKFTELMTGDPQKACFIVNGELFK